MVTYIAWPLGLLLMLVLATAYPLSAQDSTGVGNMLDRTSQLDTTQTNNQRQDPQNRQQSNQSGRGGTSTPEQEGQVNFQASDSLIFEFKEDRIATLYGSSSAVHESGELQSGKISMNLDQNLVSAKTQTPQDTLSQPVLLRDDQRIRSNEIDFNYKSEKGRFEVARIGVQDGNLIGNKVKNTGPDVVFLENAKYSTCQLDHPHYYIKADRMKVVEKEKVFFQNARLFILDIPYPLIFPFGYLPGKFDKKQSGLLQPTYVFQDQQRRGIGLKDFGWFQYFNDYLTARASVDIFTSGTYFIDAQTNYRIRNKLNGNVQVGYSKRNSGLEPTDPNYTSRVEKELRISHQQEFSPYASFNTSVNLRTEDFNQQNSFDPTERAETSTNSNINYRYRHPNNIYNFDVSIQQNQNFLTNVTSVSGPDMNFSVKRFSPFENEQTSGSESKWYENISFQYQNSFRSNYRFDPVRKDSARINWFEALRNPSKYRQATNNTDHYQFGFRQRGNVSVNQILPSRFLNVSLNGRYNEYWFPTTIRKSFNADSNEVIDRQVRGFTTARDFNANLSFSTTVYGIMNTNIGKIKSFRHTLRPNISLNYQPDFSSDYWGYYRTVQTDTTQQPNGRVPTQRYSIFENEVFSGPGAGEQRSISFGLSNVFEMKKVSRDSTGEKKEEVVRLIDQLDLNSSYNFAADSLKLANLRTNFTASILPGLDIRADADFNFYQRNAQGQRIDHFLISDSRKLMELTNFSTGTSYSVKLGERGLVANNNNQSEPNFPKSYDPLNQRIFHPVDRYFNQRPVQDFNSPFSFSVNFNYRWSLNPNPNQSNNKSATINANNISLNLTPKWNFRTQIGYDFIRKELTPSQFNLTRKLHCWDLSFTMNPFGDSKYYFFSLRINAGRLQGIIQKLPGLNNLERGSDQTGRAPRGF